MLLDEKQNAIRDSGTRGECAHGNAPDDATTWRQDVSLVDDIELVPQWEADTEGRVFIVLELHR